MVVCIVVNFDILEGSQPLCMRVGVSTLLGEKSKSCTVAFRSNKEKQNLATIRSVKLKSFRMSFNTRVDLSLQDKLDQTVDIKTSKTLTPTGIGRYVA
jgi:hypothetical protein